MPTTPVSAQEVLTNDSIVQMVRAGLLETVIVEKIRSTRTTFDLRTEALVALKQANVPDKVLEAMVEQSAQAASPASPAPPLPSSAAAPPQQGTVIYPGIPVPIPLSPVLATGASALDALPGRGTVYHILGDKQVELMPVGAKIQTSTVPVIGYTKSELVLSGNKAGYRTAERQPVFLSAYGPSEMPLVRLKLGSDDRNLKFGAPRCCPSWDRLSVTVCVQKTGLMSKPGRTQTASTGSGRANLSSPGSTGSSILLASQGLRAAKCTTSEWIEGWARPALAGAEAGNGVRRERYDVRGRRRQWLGPEESLR